jgi:hypothetical protein
MSLRGGALLLLAFTAVWAQQRVAVKDLVKFVTSSIQLKHADREVANYLKSITLTDRLDDRTIESLHGLGAGPKTLEALWKLRDSSSSLQPAARIEEPPKKPSMPPPSPDEQNRILKDVRSYALNYTKTLPDFICTQVTRRYADPSGLEFWQKLDTVTAKLTYFEQKEDYKVILINNRMVDLSVDDLGGSTSTGEFGTLLHELFDPETEARFQWLRWGKLRGRLTHVFEYEVRKDKSKWAITYEKSLTTVPAYSGLVYVDADNLMVVRVTLTAVNIPTSFPIQEASTVLDYDYADIAGQQYLLPMKFQMRMREGKALVKNDVEFRLYRKFGAEATITFTPDALAPEATTEQPAPPPSQ